MQESRIGSEFFCQGWRSHLVRGCLDKKIPTGTLPKGVMIFDHYPCQTASVKPPSGGCEVGGGFWRSPHDFTK